MAILARSLTNARATIDRRYPDRDRTSDGWIGDEAHAGRESDHNPNSRGVVDAIDIDMYGGVTPVHRPTIVAGLIVHPSTAYVIFNGRIHSARNRFRPAVYNGINKHKYHCHGSIFQTVGAEQTTIPWTLLEAFPRWQTLRRGAQGYPVRELQAYVNAWGGSLVVDGDFGPATEEDVRRFQAARRIRVDGVVGPQTRTALFS